MQSKYKQPGLTALVQDLQLCMRKSLIKFVRRTTCESQSWVHGEVCEGRKKGFESHPFMTSRGITFLFPLYQQSPLIHPPTHPLSFSLSFSSPLPPSSFPLFLSRRRLAPRSGSWCRNFSKQCSSPLCGMKKEAKLWSFCQAPLDKWADREAVRALSRFFVLNQWSLPKGHPTLLQPLI